ncbi:MAG: hypothetical protein A3J27_13230 [Candidatus Tectomicrobia bacterium RIFCSPLOWO2_12_FULL_69_37]|nr:MAG: hypothetical protein A3J27_13230 [Candidatus Tectomicrobia bacterium RIFCSPLOWO2_12_FULL_69_37]
MNMRRRKKSSVRAGCAALLVAGALAALSAWAAPAPPAAPAAAGSGEPPIEQQLESDPTLLFRFAIREFQRGLYLRAIPLLARFVEKFPQHSEHQRAIYMLADSHFFVASTGVPAEYVKAVQVYEEALKKYPDAPQMPLAYFRVGQSYQAQQKPAEAQVAFRTLIQKVPNSSLAPRAQVEIAKRFMELGDPRNAIVEFEKILRNYPNSPAEQEAHFGVADAMVSQGLYSQALVRYEVGNRRWPTFLKVNPGSLYNYAETLFQARRYPQAAQAYLQMVNIDPSAEFAHRALARLGDLYLQDKRRDEALKVYTRVIRRYPLSEGSMVSLIRLGDLVSEGEFKLEGEHIFPMAYVRDPLATYRRVIELAPTNQLAEVAYLRIAGYLKKRGEFQKALETLQEFYKKYPASQLTQNAQFLQAETYMEQVSFYFERGYFLRAIQTYTHFRASVPEQVIRQARPHKAMVVVGESYMRLGLYSQASQMFETVLADPEAVVTIGDQTLFRLAHAHLLSGDKGRAKEVAGRFLATFPRSPLRGSVQALLGEIAFGNRDLRTAASLLIQALNGELDDELRARSLFYLAEANFQEGLYPQAADAMRKAISLHSRVPGEVKPFSLEMAHFRLGDILYEGRGWLSAMVAYQNAAGLFPQSRLVGWAQHRIARIQDQLNLAGRGDSRPRPASGQGREEDPFWRDVNRIRSESRVWDDKNLSKLEQLLKGRSRN